MQQSSKVCFNQVDAFESNQVPHALDKEYHVPIVYVFSNCYNLLLTMRQV